MYSGSVGNAEVEHLCRRSNDGRDVQVTFILFTSCKKCKMWIHCFRQQLATCLMCPAPRRIELIFSRFMLLAVCRCDHRSVDVIITMNREVLDNKNF